MLFMETADLPTFTYTLFDIDKLMSVGRVIPGLGGVCPPLPPWLSGTSGYPSEARPDPPAGIAGPWR